MGGSQGFKRGSQQLPDCLSVSLPVRDFVEILAGLISTALLTAFWRMINFRARRDTEVSIKAPTHSGSPTEPVCNKQSLCPECKD